MTGIMKSGCIVLPTLLRVFAPRHGACSPLMGAVVHIHPLRVFPESLWHLVDVSPPMLSARLFRHLWLAYLLISGFPAPCRPLPGKAGGIPRMVCGVFGVARKGAGKTLQCQQII